MYVCVCKAITDKHIQSAVEQGAGSVREVRKQLGIMTQCGRCACTARDVINDALEKQTEQANLFYSVA